MSSHPSDSAGQASVELIGVLPFVMLIALVAFTFLSARTANEQAGEAAEAAAVALLQGSDPRAAAEAALPAAVRRHARVTIDADHVRVHVRPRLPLPGLAERLAGDAQADAAPRP